MPAKTARRSGRWTLEPLRSGARLTYEPSKSTERFTLDLTREQLTAVRSLARKQDPAGVRDLLLTPEAKAKTLQGAGVSALVAANTWRWALPLFGGPPPAGRSTAK